MIAPGTIQEVQNRIQIEEVIGDFFSIPLKKRGKNLVACCPFHHEKTPSFSISPTKGFYKCFGCGVAGDAITFVREMEGLSFAEAVKFLASKYGIDVQETAPDETQIQQQHEKDSLYILLSLAKDYFADLLWQRSEGQTYFKARGISVPFIKKFELGYSLDAWQAFYTFAQQKGYSDDLLNKAGLIIQKDHKTYDRFRDRVIFPIHNASGKVIAFGARTLQPDGQPKYINSPETIIYRKSEALYGLFQAKQAIREADNCYLVEGYTDVIGLHMAGVENVVASAGTSLTAEQVQLISRFAQNVTILFDGDPAGIRASLRGIDMILEKGLNVRVIPLPPGEDPDSYASQLGSTAFQEYLQTKAQDFIQFKAHLLLQAAAEDPIRRASAIQEIIQSIAAIPDPIKRAVLTQQCSKQWGIDEAMLTAEQNKHIQQKSQQAAQHTQRQLTVQPKSGANPMATPSLEDSIVAYERESIRMLLNYGAALLDDGQPLYSYLLRELEDVRFRTPVYRAILERFQEQLAQGQVLEATHFIQSTDEELQKTAIDLTATPYEVSDQWEERHQIYTTREEDDLHETVFKNVLRLKLRLLHQLIQDNREGLKNNPPPEEESKLLQIHAALKQSEAAIAKQLGVVVW